MKDEFYEYLVIGGEHDDYVFSAHLIRNLEVRSGDVAMTKMYSHDAPAEVIIPKMVSYKVHEHSRGDGKHFFIASNEDLTNVAVDDAILKVNLQAVN